MGTKYSVPIFLIAVVTYLPAPSTAALSQADFYQGKTITIIHGRDAGGSGDLRVRALILFLQKSTPGNPTFVHEYMPGGGGRKAANYIFGAVRPDGLTIGNVGGGVVANAVLRIRPRRAQPEKSSTSLRRLPEEMLCQRAD